MSQAEIFENTATKGASFSNDGKHRYSLWRIWDDSKPFVMFIGLNPSTADGETDDPTIESVIRIAKHNGYGGVYMMNCWSYIATKPEDLLICELSGDRNDAMIQEVYKKCRDVVFAWGNFDIVKKTGRDIELIRMFENPKCLTRNKNGSPGHPLYKKATSVLIDFVPENVGNKGEEGV